MGAIGVELDDLDLAAGTALVVDGLAAFFGPHAGAKTDLAGSLNGTLLVGVMHDSSNLFPNNLTARKIARNRKNTLFQAAADQGGASAVTLTVVND